MNNAELRKAFADCVGNDKLVRFCRVLVRLKNNHESLKFWQEQIWAELRSKHPELPGSIWEAQEAFLWCDVHEQQVVRTKKSRWPSEFSDEYWAAMADSFPLGRGRRVTCPTCEAAHDAWLQERAVTEKTPPEINWVALEKTLFELATAEVQYFAENHKPTDTYGFVIDCNAEYGDVMLCTNSEANLAVMHQHDGIVAYTTEIQRWNIDSWKHHGFEVGSDDFETRWAPFSSALSERMCFKSVEDSTRETFLDSLARVLLRLESEGVLNCLNPTDDFRLCLVDHNEDHTDGFARLRRLASERREAA